MFIHSKIRKLADENLFICPICGTKHPDWQAAGAWYLMGRATITCSECGSVLSVNVGDALGVSNLARRKYFILWIVMWPIPAIGLFFKLMKVIKGQEPYEKYIRIDSVGTVVTPPCQVGAEFTLTQLSRAIHNF